MLTNITSAWISKPVRVHNENIVLCDPQMTFYILSDLKTNGDVIIYGKGIYIGDNVEIHANKVYLLATKLLSNKARMDPRTFFIGMPESYRKKRMSPSVEAIIQYKSPFSLDIKLKDSE